MPWVRPLSSKWAAGEPKDLVSRETWPHTRGHGFPSHRKGEVVTSARPRVWGGGVGSLRTPGPSSTPWGVAPGLHDTHCTESSQARHLGSTLALSGLLSACQALPFQLSPALTIAIKPPGLCSVRALPRNTPSAPALAGNFPSLRLPSQPTWGSLRARPGGKSHLHPLWGWAETHHNAEGRFTCISSLKTVT